MAAQGGNWSEIQGGNGFLSGPIDSPMAMENEVCVDGKYQVSKKNKRKYKKKADHNNLKTICNAFRLLWATRQTEDIDKVNNPDKYVRITLRELFVYIGFLVILSIVAFGMVSSQNYNIALVMNSAFTSSMTPKFPFICFTMVTRIDEIWTILMGSTTDSETGKGYPLLANLFSTWYDTKSNNPNATAKEVNLNPYVGNENFVLGLSRLRQVRVRNDSCLIPKDFKKEITDCFSDYDKSLEEKRSFGPYLDQNYTNQTTFNAWMWNSEKTLKGSSFTGRMNTYDGSGFVQNLANNPSESFDILVNLFNNTWIDRATRAVFFDAMVYNPNINLFCQIKLVFELPATGGVVPTYAIRPVKLLRYVSAMDYVVLIFQIVFVLYIIYYCIEEFIEIKKHSWSYFKHIWNILDIVIICMSLVCIIFNLYEYVSITNMLDSLLANNNQYIDFEFLCYWQKQYDNAVAGIIFISWVKIFKYVSFNKTMTQLSLTLSRCAKDVAGFAIMFFIVFLAYAQLGYLIFGTQVHDFSTFSQSIFTLFRIILGDFDFEAIENANRVLGPIFFLTYVFFVFFVLLNMFIAIINDTYAEIKSELQGQKSDIELGAFFKKGYNRVMDKLNVKKAQIIDIQKAIATSDLNKDGKIDYIEFRNNLREKGYSDIEIEALFAKYDVDGDQILNEDEQKSMLKDLMSQNEELKDAYLMLEKAQAEKAEEEDRRKKRNEGVLYEDYTMLSGRLDRMEGSIVSIVGKVDTVLNKLDADEQTRNEAKAAEPAERERTPLSMTEREKTTMSLGDKKAGSNTSFA